MKKLLEHNQSIYTMSELQDLECRISKLNLMLESQLFAHRFYHEALNDVFELFVMIFSDVGDNGRGKGGLNVLRLVSRRCLQVVESVATRLTSEGDVETLFLP